jgi:hypothetical protein
VRSGASLQPGHVGKDEVDLLRRMLYAYGGSGNVAICRTEADVLFDINDATRTADNHPDWADLFVKAIANHLMADTATTCRRATWRWRAPNGSTNPPAAFFSRSMASGLTGIWQAYRQPDVWEERVARQQAAIGRPSASMPTRRAGSPAISSVMIGWPITRSR